jgi:hypothetical protein
MSVDLLEEGAVREGAPVVLPLERREERARWTCTAPNLVSVIDGAGAVITVCPTFDLVDVTSSHYGRLAQIFEVNVQPSGDLVRVGPIAFVILPPQMPKDGGVLAAYVAWKLCAADAGRWTMVASAIGKTAKWLRHLREGSPA